MSEDQARAGEREWRKRRELAVANLRATELVLRRAHLMRLLLAVVLLLAAGDALFAGALASWVTAALCVATLGINAVVFTPRAARNVDARRTELEHIQLRYDEAFDRMLAAENQALLPHSRAELNREPHRVDERHARVCPACGTPGEQDVPQHYRTVVGDNETWIACKANGYVSWRFDPNAEAAPAVTFSCPLCGEQGHRAGLDAHDIAVPEGHERQILGESEVWIVCPSPMSWTTDRWRYESL